MATYAKITLELPPELLEKLDSMIKPAGLKRRAVIIEAIKNWMAVADAQARTRAQVLDMETR